MSIAQVEEHELLTFTAELAFDVPSVFEAFVVPELLSAWYGPAGWHARAQDTVVEPWVGGMQRLTMVNELDMSASCIMQSRFLSFEPNSHVELAEQLPDPAGQPGDVLIYSRFRFDNDTVLTSTGVGAGTRVRVEIGPLPQNVHESVAQSWRSAFIRLDSLLESRQNKA